MLFHRTREIFFCQSDKFPSLFLHSLNIHRYQLFSSILFLQCQTRKLNEQAFSNSSTIIFSIDLFGIFCIFIYILFCSGGRSPPPLVPCRDSTPGLPNSRRSSYTLTTPHQQLLCHYYYRNVFCFPLLLTC